MIENNKPLFTEKEKIAMALNNAGDGEGLILDMSGTTAEDVIRKDNINKFNKQAEVYSDNFKKHAEELENTVNNLSLNPENLEIMPIGNYVLIKEFKTNPFQKMVTQNGIITDLGGAAPVFKNTDNGEYEVEESFILTGAVQEVGPECKWLKPGDAVFYTKPSSVPIPFYKAGLTLVNETRILAVINENLSKRFDEIKNK
jgi:hypothetical protein